MEKEKRSIEPETENEIPCVMHVRYECVYVSMAQKLYFNGIVEPELRAVLEKHRKNLAELANA